MGSKFTFNPVTRIIQATQVPTLQGGEMKSIVDVQVDIYSDAKEDYLSDPEFSKLQFPIRTVGGDPIDPAESERLGDAYFLDSTWKIRPYESNHVFQITGNIFSEDGTDPFTFTVGSYNVSIRSKFSQLILTRDYTKLTAVHFNKRIITESGVETIYDTDGTTILGQFQLKDKDGNNVTMPTQVVAQRIPV